MQYSTSLKLNHVFRRLYRRGSSTAGRYVVLYCRRNGTPSNRVGITVSRKLGNAVTRNRVRRRLREIYRIHEAQFLPGFDLVVVARTRSVGAPFAQLESSYLAAARKLGLLREDAV